MTALPTKERPVKNEKMAPTKDVAAVETPRIVFAKVEAPVMTLDDGGYAQRFIQLRLNEKQARKLRGLQLGLEENNAKLEDDRYVNSPLDTVRWVLENFH